MSPNRTVYHFRSERQRAVAARPGWPNLLFVASIWKRKEATGGLEPLSCSIRVSCSIAEGVSLRRRLPSLYAFDNATLRVPPSVSKAPKLNLGKLVDVEQDGMYWTWCTRSVPSLSRVDCRIRIPRSRWLSTLRKGFRQRIEKKKRADTGHANYRRPWDSRSALSWASILSGSNSIAAGIQATPGIAGIGSPPTCCAPGWPSATSKDALV
jgi:hypothetical protein